MTNGEKFKEVFKTSDVDEGLLYAFVWLSKPDEVAEINIEWWNEEYKEPTTKNDLEVDCNNCKNNWHRGDGSTYCATGDGMCHYECEEPTTKNDLEVNCIVDVLDDYANFDIPYKREIAENILTKLSSVTPQELIHGKCNQCKYYEGVHNVQGHAPCSYHKIGGVLWNWYCSQFESEKI